MTSVPSGWHHYALSFERVAGNDGAKTVVRMYCDYLKVDEHEVVGEVRRNEIGASAPWKLTVNSVAGRACFVDELRVLRGVKVADDFLRVTILNPLGAVMFLR